MKTFNLATIEQNAKSAYVEFLRESSLSVGVYQIPAGGVDKQSPHTEDEVYFVTSGRARFTLEDEETAVEPGSLIYVPAHKAHRFHSITENLVTLVFFAPAEYSRQGS